MNLNELYIKEKSGIIGRDEEISKVFLTLLRHEKPNILLTGDPGVGKTSIVHLLAELLAQELCPVWLRGYQVFEINTNELLSGPGYRGVTEEKFQKVIDSALSRKVILFFDEFHTVAHLGEMANGQTPGLGNALKPYLTRRDFKVIGATTSDELKTITDRALLRRFTTIEIGEPSDEAILKICQSIFDKYSYGKMTNNVNWHEVLLISKSLEGVNPDKIKNIIDIAVAYAKLHGSESFDFKHIDFAVNMLSKKVETAEQF